MKSPDYRKCAKVLFGAHVFFSTVLFSSSSMALVAGQWVPSQGNGVVVASGGSNLLTVCRVGLNQVIQPINQTNQPGNVWGGHCFYGLVGEERSSKEYEVLLDNGYSWINPGRLVPGPFGTMYVVSLPSNAVDGGEAGNGSRFGICEAYTPEDNTWRPGKFYANKCYIGWQGKEREVETDITNLRVRVLVK